MARISNGFIYLETLISRRRNPEEKAASAISTKVNRPVWFANYKD